MSHSSSQRSPGYRGRMILRQLAEPSRGVPRPHFRARGVMLAPDEPPSAQATSAQATTSDSLPVAAAPYI